MVEYSGSWSPETGCRGNAVGRWWPCVLMRKVHRVKRLSSGWIGFSRSGSGAGGAIFIAYRVLRLTIRTADNRGCAGAADSLEIATLRTDWVQATMLRIGVGV